MSSPGHLLRRFATIARERGFGEALRRAWRRAIGGTPPPAFVESRAAQDTKAPVARPSPGEQTRAYWDDLARREGETDAGPSRWTSHPLVRAHMNRQITGDGAQEWLPWAKAHFVPTTVARGLCLGCGRGNEAREMITLGLCREVIAVDISPVLLEIAERLTQRAGVARITYRACDLDRERLPDGPFDVIVAKMSLHHCADLPHVFGEVWRVARPRAVFLWNEYIGPSQFQWSDAQLHLINGLLAALPERYRWRAFDQVVKREIARPDPTQMPDPSESARSADIPAEFRRVPWEVLAERPYGGTLLAELLSGIVENFRMESAEDGALLETLISLEETLIARGLLLPDYCVVAARKPA